jgi:hypothetical protein
MEQPENVTQPIPRESTELELKLENLFTYHAPESNDQRRAYEAIRGWGLAFAKVICEFTPKGSDQSAAIRKVREAVMTANAAVALKGANF